MRRRLGGNRRAASGAAGGIAACLGAGEPDHGAVFAALLPPLSPGLWVALGLGVLAALAGGVTWLRGRLSYQIGRRELRLRLLGVTVRRVPLADIERISKPRRPPPWWQAENWRQPFAGTHRELVVHRRRGFFRRVSLTPRLRYEFRRQLRDAVAATGRPVDAQDEDAGEK
jgi:hypothetical protein